MLSCRLLEYRLSFGLTQMVLASKLSVSQNTISKIESGDSLPRAGLIYKILTFFDCDFFDMFYFQEVI